MSSTGTYKMVDGKLVKVSDRVPRSVAYAHSTLCSFKKPYWEEHLGEKPIFIEPKGQKAKLVKEQGLVEKGDRVHGGINTY